MTKVFDEVAGRVDYPSQDRWIRRIGTEVWKHDPLYLDEVWQEKIRQIQEIWDLPFFKQTVYGGYLTHYIEGPDLDGNRPFQRCESSTFNVDLTDQQRACVKDIFRQARRVGETLGFTFGDITCGNLMINGDTVHLIDFDGIVSWPLNIGSFRVWNNTYNLIFQEEYFKENK
jgi:hypothetical protein